MNGMSVADAISIVGLKDAAEKQIRYYSSGMKQRVKLAQAFFSDTACLMLDEPCTNLDEDGVGLYYRLVEEYFAGRTVIVSSNDAHEYAFCKETIDMRDFKR